MNNYESAIKQLKENSSWYLLLGILLIIGGTLALIYSFRATLISIIYLGFLLAGAGIFEVIKAFKMRFWGTFFLHILLSILYTAAGIFMVLNPGVNALTLTLFLGIFFMVSGIMRIIFALLYHIPHKNWLIINGVITALLGFLIWQQWPSSGLWVLGTFMGIDMLFTGWTWIQLATIAKSLPAHHHRS